MHPNQSTPHQPQYHHPSHQFTAATTTTATDNNLVEGEQSQPQSHQYPNNHYHLQPTNSQQPQQQYHQQEQHPPTTDTAGRSTIETSFYNNKKLKIKSSKKINHHPSTISTSTATTTSTPPNFQCHHKDCWRIFARKTSLTNHLKAHNNLKSRSIYRTKRARARAAAQAAAAEVAAGLSSESTQLQSSSTTPSPSPSRQTQLQQQHDHLPRPVSTPNESLPPPGPLQFSRSHSAATLGMASLTMPPPFPMTSNPPIQQQQYTNTMNVQHAIGGDDTNPWPPTFTSPTAATNELSLSFPSPRVFGGDLDPPQSLDLIFTHNPTVTGTPNSDNMHQAQGQSHMSHGHGHGQQHYDTMPLPIIFNPNYASSAYAAFAAASYPLQEHQHQIQNDTFNDRTNDRDVAVGNALVAHQKNESILCNAIDANHNEVDNSDRRRERVSTIHGQQEQNNDDMVEDAWMELSAGTTTTDPLIKEEMKIDQVHHRHNSLNKIEIENVKQTENTSTVANTPLTPMLKTEDSGIMGDTTVNITTTATTGIHHDNNHVDYDNIISPSNGIKEEPQPPNSKPNFGGGGGLGVGGVSGLAQHGSIVDVIDDYDQHNSHSSSADAEFLGEFGLIGDIEFWNE